MVQTEQRFRSTAVPELMRVLGVSRSELARRIGVSRQAVWAYEAGVTMPQFTTILRMASLAGKPLEFFVEREKLTR